MFPKPLDGYPAGIIKIQPKWDMDGYWRILADVLTGSRLTFIHAKPFPTRVHRPKWDFFGIVADEMGFDRHFHHRKRGFDHQKPDISALVRR